MDSIDRHQIAMKNGMNAMTPTPLGPIPENVQSVNKSVDHHQLADHHNQQLPLYQPQNQMHRLQT